MLGTCEGCPNLCKDCSLSIDFCLECIGDGKLGFTNMKELNCENSALGFDVIKHACDHCKKENCITSKYTF